MRDIFFWLRRLAPKKTTLCVGEEGEKIQAEIFVGCYTVFFAGAILHFSAAGGNRSECLREKLIDEDM